MTAVKQSNFLPLAIAVHTKKLNEEALIAVIWKKSTATEPLVIRLHKVDTEVWENVILSAAEGS